MNNHKKDESQPEPLPLSQLKVLEFSHSASGPYAGHLLSEWGADVIKIEPPTGAFERTDGRHHHYMGNRGKRSICLDLKSETGKSVVTELLDDYDIVIQNYRPGALENLGLGYDDLRNINERVIYCSISGFGMSGPYKKWPAFDPIAQALSGIMYMTGERDRKPARVGASLLDYGSATVACFAILMAVLRRETVGTGMHVESSLLETGFAWSGTWAAFYSLHGHVPDRMGDKIETYAPVGAYETTDGLVYLSAFGGSVWQKLCDALDVPELVTDERFIDADDRRHNRTELDLILEEQTRRYSSQQLIDQLLEFNVPCAPIHSPAEVIQDEQLMYRNRVLTAETETGDPVTVAGNPVTFGSVRAKDSRTVPKLGEHTESILQERGYNETEVQNLLDTAWVGPAVNSD